MEGRGVLFEEVDVELVPDRCMTIASGDCEDVLEVWEEEEDRLEEVEGLVGLEGGVVMLLDENRRRRTFLDGVDWGLGGEGMSGSNGTGWLVW